VIDHKFLSTPFVFKADSPEGTIEAVFSTLGVVDRGGDIVEKTAIEDGKSVPMVWSHDWSRMIGKGTVRVEDDRAVFTGNLFLDTDAGLDAYRTMKAMGDLLEYSWGFMPKEVEWIERDEKLIRRIIKAEQFEISPVLVGEGLNTGTLAIKHGLRFDEESESVLAAVKSLVTRSQSLAGLRTKEGRELSRANRDRLGSIAESLTSAARDLSGILKATEPADKGIDFDAMLADFLTTEARANGVAI